MRLIATLVLTALLFGAVGNARQAGGSVTIAVAETLGQRRFGYPVTAHVPLPRGAVADPAHAALSGETGGPMRGVQYDIRSRWPDGSVQWLDVSLNLSPGPLEAQKLVLSWGQQVIHPDPGAGVVRESPEAFTVRNVYRFPGTGESFLDSVRYGQREFLRAPARWTVKVLEEEQFTPAETDPRRESSRVIAAGPVRPVVERSGVFRKGGCSLPYRLTTAQPNSKSWFDATMEIMNPERKDLVVDLDAPYVVDKRPARFDFGVGSWLYGTLPGKTTVTLFVSPGDGWRAMLDRGTSTRPESYARQARDQARVEGWGHLIDGAPEGRAVAFGSPELGAAGAEGSLSVSADGDTRIEWKVRGKSRVRVRALFHHVADPVHLSAVTSPAAMLHPLQVSLPAKWYRRCGLSAKDAPSP